MIIRLKYVDWRIVKNSNSKRAVIRPTEQPPEAIVPPGGVPQTAPGQRSKEARNRANTIKNSAKVEQYLMEVEKVHGFAESWALREKLEQGLVSFNELKRL